MSIHSQPSIHWRSALAMTAGCLTGWLFIPFAPAQESQPSVLVASLSVSRVQPDFILNSVRDKPDRPLPRATEPTDWSIPGLHRKPTDADAWQKFEAEYRPDPPNPSFVKRQIETAKFGLDTTAFAVDRFLKSIRDHADFEFDHGRFRQTRSNPRGGSSDNPRVKLDLDLKRGRPQLGVRVVIPFGN